jgi:hypothetical protein
MRQCLDTLNLCIARYDKIARHWDETKNWNLISPMRIEECETRFSFICKIRDAANKTITRFEEEAHHHQAAN